MFIDWLDIIGFRPAIWSILSLHWYSVDIFLRVMLTLYPTILISASLSKADVLEVILSNPNKTGSSVSYIWSALCLVMSWQCQEPEHYLLSHDDVIKWKKTSALLALCAGNSPVTGVFLFTGQWRGPLMFSLICRVSNWDTGDLGRLRAH